MRSACTPVITRELETAVALDALRDADAVIAFLRAVEERGGTTWERPVRFPPAFLLGAGAALRLAGWEAAGLRPHRDAGLGDAATVFRQVGGWCLRSPPAERDRQVYDLCVNVLKISVDELAWLGPVVLGAAVLLGDAGDEDALLDAIAEIAWKYRHKEARDDAR